MALTLHPLSAEDADPMLEILTSNIVSKTYMLPDFECREAAQPLFRRLMELSLEENRYVRGIYENGKLIGFLNDVEILDATIELGYVIHPQHQGKGYMTEALREAISDLFQKGYDQVICGAFEHNAASIRVMEKAGMHQMAKTDEIDYRGEIHRCVYYSTEKAPTNEGRIIC